MAHIDKDAGSFGLMAEFPTPTALVSAARKARESGYTKIDAYSPFPIEELTEAMRLPRNRVPLVVLIGGLLGMAGGYGLEYWSSVMAYPLNIGGRPFHSMPAFIVPAYETTILFASIAAVVGMVMLNGLPMPYHPMFNHPDFELASQERFFLVIERRDPKFDPVQTRQFLENLKPASVLEVAK